MSILIATETGLHAHGDDRSEPLVAGAVRAVDGDWAIVDSDVVHLPSGARASLPVRPWCVVGDGGGGVMIGAAEARLFRWAGNASDPEPVPTFDAIPTRDGWYTPWGAPPDIRSITRTASGTVLVNVHVGGVWREEDGGWNEVVVVDDDTHQVVADGDRVAAAAAVGVGRSDDGGRTWRWTTDGLHATYCRAAAIAGDTLVVTASTGASSKEGAVYRTDFGAQQPFERGGAGLPASFPFNLDTRQLAAQGNLVALGTEDGELWVSEDAARSWELVDKDLGAIRCVSIG